MIEKDKYFKSVNEQFGINSLDTMTHGDVILPDVVEMDNKAIIEHRNGQFLLFKDMKAYQDPLSTYTTFRSFRQMALYLIQNGGKSFSSTAMFSSTSEYATMLIVKSGGEVEEDDE